VSVHPLLQHVVLNVIRNRVKRGLQEPVPFATVVTDLTKCHPTWYHNQWQRARRARPRGRGRAGALTARRS